jgi:predicted metal-dependent phosphotriesterase family hydrolase
MSAGAEQEAAPPQEPQVLTLLGPCRCESLGFTLASEHLSQNRAAQYRPGSDAATLGQAPLALTTLGDVRRRPYASLVNLRLDVKDAGMELTRLSRAAGSGSSSAVTVTVVDTTPRGWRAAEDLPALAQLAIDCRNVRLVLGTGCVAAMEAETAASDLAASFLSDLKQGFPCGLGTAAAAGAADGGAEAADAASAAATAPQGYVLSSRRFLACFNYTDLAAE